MIPANVRMLAILALLALPHPAHAWDLSCRFAADRQASIDTTGAERIEILARAGDLDIRPATGSTLATRGQACASSQAYLDQTRLHVRRDGSTIVVHVQTPDDMQGIGFVYPSLDLTVEVPEGIAVQVTDSSGDITIDAVRVVKVLDSSGDIEARRLPAAIEIEDNSGDLTVLDAAGDVQISDSSGDIVVRGARGVHIVQDSSGDISIERVAGDVQIEQDSSGDITVSGVGGNFELLADGSGKVQVTEVKGSVRLP